MRSQNHMVKNRYRRKLFTIFLPFQFPLRHNPTNDITLFLFLSILYYDTNIKAEQQPDPALDHDPSWYSTIIMIMWATWKKIKWTLQV